MIRPGLWPVAVTAQNADQPAFRDAQLFTRMPEGRARNRRVELVKR